MRVLLINFEMDLDSPVLAWQARVAKALAPHCTSLHVLTEKIGAYESASNMSVDVMPRRPWGIPKRFGGGFIVNWQLHQLLKKYPCDVCFIHMAHTWAYRLWPILRLHHLPIVLWYAHGSVTWHLKLATACVQQVITSTPDGFRIPSPKTKIIGQAIDTDLFVPAAQRTVKPEIVYVGRLSARKRILLLVDVLAALRALDPTTPWCLKLIGPMLTADDHTYELEVKTHIAKLGLTDCVEMPGAMTQAQTVDLYQTAALHLNVSNTGSMDKTVMEALACGCPVLTTNEAFREALAELPGLFSKDHDAQSLAQSVLAICAVPPAAAKLRGLVLGKHDLTGWINKVIAILKAQARS